MIPLFGFSQALGFLDFSIETVGTNVRVHWIVAAGNQCQDVEIQHSLDGENFKTFYTFAGICGDPNFELGYDHTHENPVLNRANYYRIKIYQDRTQALRTFVSGKEQLNILKDPTTGLTQIKFQDKGGAIKLSIFGISGRLLFSKKYSDAQHPIYLPSEVASPFVIQLEQNGSFLAKKYL